MRHMAIIYMLLDQFLSALEATLAWIYESYAQLHSDQLIARIPTPVGSIADWPEGCRHTTANRQNHLHTGQSFFHREPHLFKARRMC